MMDTDSWRGFWRTFSSVRHSRTRARVISDYVQQSCHDGYRFVEECLEDIQFNEGLIKTMALT